MILLKLPAWSLVASAVVAGVALAQQVPLAQPSASHKSPVLNAAVRAKISALAQAFDVPGYSLAVYSERAGQETFQWGNMSEKGDAVAADTIFELASTSKAFTALALGLVMDDFKHGRNVTALPGGLTDFTWTTKLNDLLPEDWKLMDDWAFEAISVRDFLSHVSGVPRHELSYYHGEAAIDVIRRMRYLRPAYELRETWHYNNMGYMTAQHLVEKYSQKSLPDFVAERIFGPLNMTSSSYSPSSAASTGRLSEFYHLGRRIPIFFTEDDMPVMGGAGGVLTTAEDMMKWGRMLLGITSSESVGIPRQILQDCMSPQVLMQRGTSLTYGFGWIQLNVLGTEVVFHDGGIPGAATAMVLLPQHNMSIVQLANDVAATAANNAILATILAEVLADSNRDILATMDLFSLDRPHFSTHAGASDVVLNAGDLDTFAGTYEDPGYGSLVLCSSHRPSSRCETVLSNFTKLDGSLKNTLYGYYKSLVMIAKEIRLVALDTHVFSYQATTLFPDGYGSNTTAFEVNLLPREAGVEARFIVSEYDTVRGFGLFGLAGEVLERERTATTIEDQAEVWFKKVD